MSTSILTSTGAPAVGIGCNCLYCVEPLNVRRQPVKDIQIRSVGYDRRRGRLEIEFTWTDDAPVLSGCTGFVSPIARGETDIFVLESSLGFEVSAQTTCENRSRRCADDCERAWSNC